MHLESGMNAGRIRIRVLLSLTSITCALVHTSRFSRGVVNMRAPVFAHGDGQSQWKRRRVLRRCSLQAGGVIGIIYCAPWPTQ